MLIFDIKRYAIHDGPGIRITIFMKGCPLSCIWCHNPEGISPKAQKLYTRKRCIGCGSCVAACPTQALRLGTEGIVTDLARCQACGTCASVCPTLAMEMSGVRYGVEEVMREIEKETLLMDRSEGGVTFCGGEPLSHPDDLIELLVRCGELGIHRAVDTTLMAHPDVVRRVMACTDLFLIDLKMMNAERHRRFTGLSNERILANIRMVAEAGKDFFIRIPLIDGVNADEENIASSASFLASLPWKRKMVNLLPYHDIGKGKHEKLGTIYNPEHLAMAKPSDEVIRRCIAQFESVGIHAEVGA